MAGESAEGTVLPVARLVRDRPALVVSAVEPGEHVTCGQCVAGDSALRSEGGAVELAHEVLAARAAGDRRRWPGCRPWRPGRQPWGWWVRMWGRAGRGRCSCIRVRVRSGRGWAGSCWPMSRRSPRRWPSWSRTSWRRSGSLYTTCWPAEGQELDRHRADSAGVGGCSVGVDCIVALVRGGTRCGDRAFDGRGDRGGGGRGAESGRRVSGDRQAVTVDVPARRQGRDSSAGAQRRTPPRR